MVGPGPFVGLGPFQGNMAYSLSKPSQRTTTPAAFRLMGTNSVSMAKKADYQRPNSSEALFLWHRCLGLLRPKGRCRHDQDELTQGLGQV